MSTLGQRIRTARELRGMTQAELADLVGVARKSVVNWEAGTYSPQNSMARLTQVLGDLADDPDVGVTEHSGVLLDLPAEALEGLTDVERAEVVARIKAAAYQVAREIRHERPEQ